jgi:hypothetical protein
MSDSFAASQLVPAIIAVAVALFAIDLWRVVADAARALGPGARRAVIGAGLLLGLWGAAALLATLAAPLNEAIRSVPLLQPALALASIVALLLLGFSPAFRQAFDAVPIEAAMTFFYWRAVFGALLIGAYAAGRLPADFGIPVGLGDMSVTLLAILVLTLKTTFGEVPRGPVWLWNAAGLADLLYAFFLAATVLRPWAVERGLPANFGMLNFVVPLFIVIHLHMFGRLWRAARPARGDFRPPQPARSPAM